MFAILSITLDVKELQFEVSEHMFSEFFSMGLSLCLCLCCSWVYCPCVCLSLNSLISPEGIFFFGLSRNAGTSCKRRKCISIFIVDQCGWMRAGTLPHGWPCLGGGVGEHMKLSIDMVLSHHGYLLLQVQGMKNRSLLGPCS